MGAVRSYYWSIAMRKSQKEQRARTFTNDGHTIIPCTATDRSELTEEIEPYVSKPEMRRPFRDDRGTEQRRDSPAQEAAERGRPARDVGIQAFRGSSIAWRSRTRFWPMDDDAFQPVPMSRRCKTEKDGQGQQEVKRDTRS